MNSRTKGSLVISLLLLMFMLSGTIKGCRDGTNTLHLLRKGGSVETNSRKLLGVDAALDYGDTGPNPKHEPRRRGGGGRNP